MKSSSLGIRAKARREKRRQVSQVNIIAQEVQENQSLMRTHAHANVFVYSSLHKYFIYRYICTCLYISVCIHRNEILKQIILYSAIYL